MLLFAPPFLGGSELLLEDEEAIADIMSTGEAGVSVSHADMDNLHYDTEACNACNCGAWYIDRVVLA